MNRIILLCILALISVLPAPAKGNERVSGSFTYIGAGHESRDECRRKAYEGACVEAVASKFGWIVSGTTSQVETVDRGRENTYFNQQHRRAARGEWVADDGEPRYEYSFDAEGCLTVTCAVKGFARALSNERPDFEAIPLREGTGRGNAATAFKSGDTFALMLHVPADGYAAVFLIGDDRVVNTLLPYSGTDAWPVKGGRDVVLFDRASAPERDRYSVNELILTADTELDHYRLCVLYSARKFARPNADDSRSTGIASLSLADFDRWLNRATDADPSMAVRDINITVAE